MEVNVSVPVKKAWLGMEQSGNVRREGRAERGDGDNILVIFTLTKV